MWDTIIRERSLLMREQSDDHVNPRRPCYPTSEERHHEEQLLQQKYKERGNRLQIFSTYNSANESNQGNGVWIVPEPHCVLKLRQTSGKKLFVNLCVHPKVEPLHMKELRLSTSGENIPQEGLRIPLSIGPITDSLDKAGIECLVCDVVFNEETLAKCNKDPQIQRFLGAFVSAALNQKFAMNFQDSFAFPKLVYHGTRPQAQLIRLSNSSKISVVNSEEEGALDRSESNNGGGEMERQETRGSLEALLHEMLKWDGCFASPADTHEFLKALEGQQRLLQDYYHPDSTCITQQDLDQEEQCEPLCWMQYWKRNQDEILPVGAFNAIKSKATKGKQIINYIPGNSLQDKELCRQRASNKLKMVSDFRRAFLSSCTRTTTIDETDVVEMEELSGKVYVLQLLLPRGNDAAKATAAAANPSKASRICDPAVVSWEFQCMYKLKVTDLILHVLPLRKSNTRSIPGFRITFPLALRADAANAFVCPAFEENMTTGTAFLLTIIIPVDAFAVLQCSRIAQKRRQRLKGNTRCSRTTKRSHDIRRETPRRIRKQNQNIKEDINNVLSSSSNSSSNKSSNDGTESFPSGDEQGSFIDLNKKPKSQNANFINIADAETKQWRGNISEADPNHMGLNAKNDLTSERRDKATNKARWMEISLKIEDNSSGSSSSSDETERSFKDSIKTIFTRSKQKSESSQTSGKSDSSVVSSSSESNSNSSTERSRNSRRSTDSKSENTHSGSDSDLM